jgi:hypothetical protein
MTPREYIEKAMTLADAYCNAADLESRDAIEAHLREHLDDIIEAAYDKGLEDRDED